jgi:ABC-type lipoprotein release transport system permease subunit
VVIQALVAALAGTGRPVVAYGAATGIMAARPQFLITLDPRDVIQSFVAGLGMALVAALFPARVVAGLAPADVFRK